MESIPDLGSIPIAWEQVISSLNHFDTYIIDQDNIPYEQQKGLGIKLFLSFCKLGQSLKANNITALNEVSQYLNNVNSIIKGVEKHQDTIENFLFDYAFSEIDFEGAVIVRDVCGVRSGVHFLFEYFSNITNNFDAVLESFKEDISDFDQILHTWVNSGCIYPVPSDYIPANIPLTHWWWPC